MDKFDPQDPYGYEGRFCWPVNAALGAVGMALWAAVICLVWRGAAELGWMRFDQGVSIFVMVVGAVLGALVGVLEHHGRHQVSRRLAAYTEMTRPQQDEQGRTECDEQHVGGAR